jgi:hypothetical protein
MTPTVQRRGFNDIITRFWGVAAPAYNHPFLQQWVYRPAHDEVVAPLRDRGVFAPLAAPTSRRG